MLRRNMFGDAVIWERNAGDGPAPDEVRTDMTNRATNGASPERQAFDRPNGAPVKDLYEIGEIPPLGHVPATMYAWVVRKDRHGPPEQSMQVEVVPTWTLDRHD